jgi:hypothetical protein
MVWVGAALGVISGLGEYLDESILRWSAIEGIAVWLTFIAGTLLFQALKEPTVLAFRPPLPAITRRIGVAILLAIPLAVLNNVFFYLQNGAPQFRKALASAAKALSPGIHEEAVFRYFILAVCFSLLQHTTHRRLALAAAIGMAVIPHSLIHFPDLLLENPGMAVGLFVATSLLFGLPLAVLQIKRSFESAVTFHWFIDFFRFWFGY